MSALVRFKAGEIAKERYIARVFERGSRKGECRLCGETAYGVLVRFLDPVRRDSVLCFKCLLLVAAKEFVVKPKVKPPVKRTRRVGRPRKPGRKKGFRFKKKPLIEKSITAGVSDVKAQTVQP